MLEIKETIICFLLQLYIALSLALTGEPWSELHSLNSMSYRPFLNPQTPFKANQMSKGIVFLFHK